MMDKVTITAITTASRAAHHQDMPFGRAWGAFSQAVLDESAVAALGLTAKMRSVYRPAALRKRVRKLAPDALHSAPREMWIDILDAAFVAEAAYALGRLRWELDDLEGAIDAFRSATELPDGEWALADSLLWSGHVEEAERRLRAIASTPGPYRPFARVLLATELLDAGAASWSDYEAAARRASEMFGEGPSQQNFARAFREHVRGVDRPDTSELRRGSEVLPTGFRPEGSVRG